MYLAFTMASIVSLSCGLNWPLPVSTLRVTCANLQGKQNKNNKIINYELTKPGTMLQTISIVLTELEY